MGIKPSLSSFNSKAKNLTRNKPILIILLKTNGIQGETKSISSVNQSILQYTPCSDSKKLPMYCNFPVVGGGMSLTTPGRLLWPCWQDGSNSQKINVGQLWISWEICQCSWIGFFNFLPVQMVIRSDRSSRPQFASKFLPLSLDFLILQHSSYVHSIFTITGQSLAVNSEEFHSWASKIRQVFTVWCTLTHWKWTTHYEHNMTYHMANWSSQNKLGQVPLQGHTAYARYLHRGITSPPQYSTNSLQNQQASI